MILVTGGTGLIGRQVVARLIADGHRVRCLLPVNRQRKLPWDAASDVEIVTGTVLDEEALFQAVTGVHTILHLESAQWWGRPRDLERVELVGTRNLITVARSARVGRIIAISHLGAAPASAFSLLRIKGMLEELLRSSGLAYTIIRSGIVFGPDDAFVNHIAMMMATNPLFFLMPGQGEVVLHPLYIDDLIDAIMVSLETIDTVDEVIEIGGPEYITLEDLIRTVMRVTGMHRAIIRVPPYVMRWTTAFYETIFRRALMTQQWLDIMAASRTARLGNMINVFGLHPRRFEDTLVKYMPGRSFLLSSFRYALRRGLAGYNRIHHTMSDIEIRPLRALNEMYAAVELQKIHWGTDIESIVPAHMLFTIASYGGHVLAAFDGERIVGVLIGLLGTNMEDSHRPAMANLLIASKRMVISPEYRNHGIGHKLKLAQRDIAIKQGIRLVTWTFDPLLAANAHLNLRKLGCVCQKYLEDYYGTGGDSGLTTLGASDRLWLDWWVTSRRVEERLTGSRVDLTVAQYLEANATILNPTSAEGKPADHLFEPQGAFSLLEIPLNYLDLVKTDEGLARVWRSHTRQAFEYLMTSGYVVTDFLRDSHEGRDRGFYLLSYNMGFDFSLN